MGSLMFFSVSTFNTFNQVAYILLFGFALMLPFSLASFIAAHKHDLHSVSTRSKLGWLYPRFVNGAEFWEGKTCRADLLDFCVSLCVVIHSNILFAFYCCALAVHEVMRKMLLTGIIMYFSANVRPMAAIVVCLIACCSLNYFEPHKSRIVFWSKF